MDHFKRANEHWRFVRMVIVDKDMREIDFIRKKLPEARVLLCHFHVIKWLHETIRKSKKYGVYEEDVLAQMKHTITNMAYARTPAAYTSHRDEFKSLAHREDRTELWDYFDKNWDECCEMWVMAYRVGLPHFGNHTNNRVESLFGKLKRYLKGHLTMRASLKVLLAYQRRKEEEYKAKVEMPGTLRDVSYCEQMNIALGMTTRWVAAAIKTQYDVATDDSITDNYAFKDNGTTITVQYDEHEYTLEKEGWTCNCEFAQTMKLPCRHAMAYRKTCGNPLIIPFSSISPRWFGQSRLSQDELTEVEQPFVAKVFKKKPRAVAGALSEAEKYRRAQQALGRISGELAQVPDEVFESAMSDLDKWWYNLRHGKTDLLPPPSSGDDGTGSGGGGGGNGGGAPGGSASPGEGPQEDHHDDNAGEGNMQVDDGSDDEPPTQVTDSTAQAARDGGCSRQLSVRLSGNVRRQGRPPLGRAAQKEKAKMALKECNNGTNLLTLLREKDVCEVVATLHDVKPGVRELGSFLATLQVKSQGQGKPIEWRVDTEYVPDTVRFRLLESVVDSALEQLRHGLSKNEQIELDSEGEAAAGGDRYVAAIAKVGQFTRDQVESMKWLWNLQATCRVAVICCSWLHRDVKAAHAPPSPCTGAFTELLENWSYNELRGFGFDLTYSDLYCFRDSAWLNDDAMKAFAVVLANYKNDVTITATPQRHGEATQKKRSRKGLLSSKALEDVVAGVSAHAFVLLPVNFGDTHWGCLVVDRDAKQVKTYDSKNGKRNKQRLKKIASEIIAADATMASYTTVEVTEPLQSDSDNCGVFVCRFLWTCVSDDAPSDVTPTGITKLRWAMLEAILKTNRR